jgi:dsDNA-specific endonuclease/ATPase MutS2
LQTGFRISYRFEPGFNAESKGLKAAQLAGLPQEGLEQAKATFDLIRRRREIAQKLAGDQRMLEPPFRRLEKANRRQSAEGPEN